MCLFMKFKGEREREREREREKVENNVEHKKWDKRFLFNTNLYNI